MTTTYDCIAATTLGSNTNIVTFTGISQAYTDLILIANAQTTTDGYYEIRVGNGSIDTGTNYSYTNLFGDGTGANTIRDANIARIFTTNSGIQMGATGVNYPLIVHFQNYSNTSTNKTILFRHNSPSGTSIVVAGAGLWRNTSAINQISIQNNFSAANYTAGSTFTIYGIKAE